MRKYYSAGVIACVVFLASATAALAAAPVISSVSPSTAHVGDTVTLSGENFDGNTIVEFFNTLGGFVGVGVPVGQNSATSYTLTVPPNTKGQTTIKIRQMYSTLVSNAITMNVLPIAPVIEYVGSGVAYQVPTNTARPMVTELLVQGKNIDTDSVFQIDGMNVGGPVTCRKNFISGTCLYVPKSIMPGAHSLSIRQSDSGLMSNAVPLTVINDPILSTARPYPTFIQFCGVGIDLKSVALFDGVTEGAAITANMGEPTVCFSYKLPTSLSVGMHTVQIKQSDTGGLSNSLSIRIDAPVATSVTTPTPVGAASAPGTNSPAVYTPVATTPGVSTSNTSLQQALDALRAQMKAAQQKAQVGLTTPAATPTLPVITPPSGIAVAVCARLSRNISQRASDRASDRSVTALQNFLIKKGFLDVKATGYFGPATFAAVKKFQKANMIMQTGTVGPQTRAKIAALDCGQ